MISGLAAVGGRGQQKREKKGFTHQLCQHLLRRIHPLSANSETSAMPATVFSPVGGNSVGNRQ
jgi:hypothetical protein